MVLSVRCRHSFYGLASRGPCDDVIRWPFVSRTVTLSTQIISCWWWMDFRIIARQGWGCREELHQCYLWHPTINLYFSSYFRESIVKWEENFCLWFSQNRFSILPKWVEGWGLVTLWTLLLSALPCCCATNRDQPGWLIKFWWKIGLCPQLT